MIKIIAAILAIIATIDASLILNPNTILQGPSSKSILKGPDGSSISAEIPGGKVIVEDPATIAATPVIVEPVLTLVAAPVILESAAVPIAGSISAIVSSDKVIVQDPPVVADSVTEIAANTSENVTKIVIAETPTLISPVPIIAELPISPLILSGQTVIGSPLLVYSTGQTVIAGPSGVITTSEPLSANNLLVNNLW